jgi:protein TonB
VNAPNPMSATLPLGTIARMPRVSRNVVVAGAVVLAHAAALYALHAGLLKRVVELVVPVQMISEVITPPAPRVELPKPAPVPAPAPAPRVVPKPQPRTPPPLPAPRPVAAPSAEPAPNAPVAAPAPQPAPPPIEAPVVAAPAPAPAPPAPPRVELPSSDADYLQNPQPAYPPMSKRLGEQGQVMLRVLIGADGLPKEAQVSRSSGYARLDTTARETVLKWRFVPGKRNGVPETMWFNVPINFVLE